jgi:hypothetical protein
MKFEWNRPAGKLFGLRSKSSQKDPAEEKFRRLIQTAKCIAQINPRGLPDLVHAILRPYQLEYLLGVAERGQDAMPRIESPTFFAIEIFDWLYSADGRFRGVKRPPSEFKLHLGRHLVLPWPWSENSYVNRVAQIGTQKIGASDERARRYSAPWEQDDNHRVELWLPWGIGFVKGGNHSITAGILAGEGIVKPSLVYDMSFVLDDISSDGLTYRDSNTGRIIGRAADHRIAAVFEIGRIMISAGFPAFWQETAWCRRASDEITDASIE